LIIEENKKKSLIFSSGSSDNKEKIYFAIGSSNEYIFQEGEKKIPYIKTNITEGNEMIEPQLCFMSVSGTNQYIVSIGRENSKIGVLEINKWPNDYLIINSTSFFGDNNRRNEGIEPYASFFNNHEFFYGTITTKSDEPENYYLSLYHYTIEGLGPGNNNFYFNLDSPNDKYIDMTKSNYASCILINRDSGDISCFYLSKENFYTIAIIEKTVSNDKDYDFIIHNKTTVGTPSNSVENEVFFLKANYIGKYKALYSYFSGKNDSIPTFLIREIKSDYSLDNIYQDFPVIYLYDYVFNNKLKYNDLALIDNNKFFLFQQIMIKIC
jgi:hypothetical protein